MQVRYDPQADIILVELDRSPGRRTKGGSLPFGQAYADLAGDGTILAIEIRNASAKYPKEALDEIKVTHPPMSLAEAAEHAGITAHALRKACERGTLDGHKIGRNWTVTWDALQDYLDGRWARAKKEESVA